MLLQFHPDLWPELLAWLENRGLEVGRVPDNLTIRTRDEPVYLVRERQENDADTD